MTWCAELTPPGDPICLEESNFLNGGYSGEHVSTIWLGPKGRLNLRARAMRYPMNFNPIPLFICLLQTICWPDVPPPLETPVEVIVSGRTSTLKSITIVNVGQEVPRTYAGKKMNNTPGFTWYVSRHFALKSQMDEGFSRSMLEVSELAYPHWVQLIGREPSGIDYTRMAIVYAKDRKEVDTAVGTDFGSFWAGGGGGVTFPHNKSAYNYPSGGLRYHKRDLVIHENLHMLQFCAVGGKAPLRFMEGITHGASNHVYDDERKQLTVAVFDKATVNNPIDKQLAGMREKFFTMSEFLEGAPGQPIVLYSHFFWTHPERLLKWRLWRDGLFALKPWDDLKENDTALMLEIFGPLQDLEADWKRWIGERHNSFHFVEWGWEQSANMLWSYGWPWDKTAYSRTNIRYTPGTTLEADPLRLDFPAYPMTAIVGPIKLGAPEPSVGCAIDFSQTPNAGVAGLGFGVDDKSYCPVLIAKGQAVTFGGYKFGLPGKSFPIPGEVQQAAKADGYRFGLTVQIGNQKLKATVRAGKPESMKEVTAEVPIDAEQRKKIMESQMAVLSKDGRHGVMPFFGHEWQTVDLTEPAPPNRWRFERFDHLYGLYKAAFRLGSRTPESLSSLSARMLSAVDKDPDAQTRATAAYDSEISKVALDIKLLKAGPELKQNALSDLSGLWLDLELTEGHVPEHLRVTASIGGLLDDGHSGRLRFSVQPSDAIVAVPEVEAFDLKSSHQLNSIRTYRLGSESGAFTVTAHVDLAWRGETITLTTTRACRTSIPRWHVIGPFNNPGGGEKDIKHAIENSDLNLKQTYPGRGGTVSWLPFTGGVGSGIQEETFVDFTKIYGGDNVAAYASTQVLCPEAVDAILLIGSDDGVVAWLNGKRVHTNLVSRGYHSKEDVVRIRLDAGQNSLLVKVAQGFGGWAMAAHIVGMDGLPIPGIRYD